MYLKHNVHKLMLENIFQQQQGCKNDLWQVACGVVYILCSSALIFVGRQCGTSFMSPHWHLEVQVAF
jgi:hypothetical protein